MAPDSLYWYASIFLWLFCTGVGIPPVPEEAGILYAAGLAAVNDDVYWWIAWPATSLGIIAADLLLYGAGRLWGTQILEHRWVGRMLAPERRRTIEDRFHRYGMQFLLMARLLPPLRTGVFLIAGTIRYSLTRFLIADCVYGVVGVGVVFFGGTALMALFHKIGGWLMFSLAVVAVGLATIYYYRYLRKLELKATEKAVEAIAPVVAPEEVLTRETETTEARGDLWPDPNSSLHEPGNHLTAEVVSMPATSFSAHPGQMPWLTLTSRFSCKYASR